MKFHWGFTVARRVFSSAAGLGAFFALLALPGQQSLASSLSTLRVNSGGAAYTDSQGKVWSADYGFTGGSGNNLGGTITGTSDPLLYQDYRLSMSSYSFAVANGVYLVTLKFAETGATAAGQRIFNVAINGSTVLTNFDIYAAAGGEFKAVDRAFPITVANGTVSIAFTNIKSVARISALSILPAPPTSLKYSQLSASYVSGSPITNNVPTSSGGPVVSYAVSPALPAGLSLNTTTGVISGTPTASKAAANYVVTATNSGGSALATLTIAVTTSTAATLPIEVAGSNGTTVSTSLSVPGSTSLTGTQLLWLKVHNFKYQDMISVQVGSSPWISLDSATVTLQGLANAYGGIGGGFSTLQLTVHLPQGAVTTGTNAIRFKFNSTDGRSSAFRILDFSLQTSAGATIVQASSTLVQDNPATWQPPLNNATDIAAGKSLWYTSKLSIPVQTGGVSSISVSCTGCHTQDGRDLKYFNYSNYSIEARAVFHGLSALQGQQIASYIRSLTLPNPGRPWNPPYQPGPGLDSQPVANWAAGAGLSAVLSSDAAMWSSLAPSGSTAGWASTGDCVLNSAGSSCGLNARQIPIALQLLDWNSWLPAVHPLDGFGTTFSNSTCNTLYSSLRSGLIPNNAASYKNALGTISDWINGCDQTYMTSGPNFVAVMAAAEKSAPTAPSTAALRSKIYSNGLWLMVKSWELNQEFGLEAMPQVPFGVKANVRGWYQAAAFNTSPNIMAVPAGTGVANGSQIARDYLSFIWYQTQLILHDGQGVEDGQRPLDWGYVYNFIDTISNENEEINGISGTAACYESSTPEAMLQMLWIVKALQEETLSGASPAVNGGFQPVHVSPEKLVDIVRGVDWVATSPQLKAQILNAYVSAWYSQVSSFNPQDYYAIWANATQDPSQIDPTTTLAFGGQLWYAFPRLRFWGVNPILVSQASVWAAKIFPLGNWSLNETATCSLDKWDPRVVHCTSDTAINN